MTNKNKIFTLFIIITLCISSFSGCDSANANKKDKLSVVCTIFPQYDWVKEILGDKADNYDLTILLDDGVDLHSYQPTADDIIKISDCDVFIYVGGESDAWVDDALKEATNKNMQVIDLLDVLDESELKEEESVEGMEQEDEEETEEDGEIEYDEHVWLSLKNANTFSQKICDVLSTIDTNNANTYKENYKNYSQKLTSLDKQYQDLADSSTQKTVLFGDRFPFRYLVDDYNINYYAAFIGCSAETEASFETIIFLANKVDELKLPAVLVIDNSKTEIAKSVVENTTSKKEEILAMDSMQSVTADDIENGYTYLSAMNTNLETLKKALK